MVHVRSRLRFAGKGELLSRLLSGLLDIVTSPSSGRFGYRMRTSTSFGLVLGLGPSHSHFALAFDVGLFVDIHPFHNPTPPTLHLHLRLLSTSALRVCYLGCSRGVGCCRSTRCIYVTYNVLCWNAELWNCASSCLRVMSDALRPPYA